MSNYRKREQERMRKLRAARAEGRICQKCKYWSRTKHHPTSKWFWKCECTKDQYSGYDFTCDNWKLKED